MSNQSTHRWISHTRAAVSIAGIICQLYGVLCESGPYSIYFASVYLEAIDFVSIRYVNHDEIMPSYDLLE
jgi:hypothetical protein